MLDQRLFDNAAGLEAGNSDSEDDNLYDKPLFADRSAVHAQTLSSQGQDKGKRTEPVKFEIHKESMFGMESLMRNPAKKVKKDWSIVNYIIFFVRNISQLTKNLI